jgi:four helix bundle protein
MKEPVRSYRDLIVWQKAMDLADLVYDITEHFPSREQFGLAFQFRKAAVSIPSNIAEGTRHRTPGYLHRIVIALGEHAELETQMLVSERRGYVRQSDRDAFWPLSTEVGKLAHGLHRSLENQLPT